jgi:large subunit ribosomal protein L5
MENKMREIEIEKMVLNCGATGEKLDRSQKLLEMITKRKAIRSVSTKRIPAFGISPGKQSGCKITLRNKAEIIQLLKRFFTAVSNKISIKKIEENHFSFGIHEYIEVPGLEYRREIGMLGFDISVVFKRKGKSIVYKKNKTGKYPIKQKVTKEEIVQFLIKNLGVNIGK